MAMEEVVKAFGIERVGLSQAYVMVRRNLLNAVSHSDSTTFLSGSCS